MRRFSMTAVMIIVAAMCSFTAPAARAADGVVLATGWNGYGQLGNGTTTNSLTPVSISGLSGVVTIAVGESHNLALLSNGTVKAWGGNTYGQLGNGTAYVYGGTDHNSTPVSVSGLSGAVAVAGGDYFSLALLSNGTVKGWGNNSYGQLGNPTSEARVTPASVSGLSSVVAVATGKGYSLALLNDGTVKSLGYNGYGELGNGTTSSSSTPVSVSGLSGVTAVAAGGEHGLAVLSDGTVKAWGRNNNGQLGNGTVTNSSTPVSVSSLSGVVAVAAGYHHSLALLSNGTVKAWGRNNFGQLGNGTTIDSSTPVSVSSLSGVAAVAAGYDHSLAVLNDGTIKAWGSNDRGQLGDGTTIDRPTPVTVSGLSGMVAVAGGNEHSLFVGVDNAGPGVVSTSPASGATECSVQTIVLLFSENVLNVTPDDLQISSGSVTGVSGSGNSYTFTISGASGTVIATLDGDITDTFGNDLAPYVWSFLIDAITDSDNDGTLDCLDGCPNDPNKIAPGQCGCGTPDTDSDGDGTADCNDGCPNDPNKIALGQCGCGTPDTDSDSDGTANCNDGCPNDTGKTAPGVCGCGTPDTDSDGDGTANCLDGCPNDPNKIAPGQCGCGFGEGTDDSDGDGTIDCLDGCPNDPNKIAPGVCGCGMLEGTCRIITQWRSVRTHTGVGELAIVLNAMATTTATVETRGTSAATQGVRKVQIDFSGPVTLVNAANITVTYRPTIQGGSPSIGSPVSVIPSSVVMADADTLDIIFTAGQLPNLGCANITIGAGTFAETIAGDTDCNIRVLAGDVNSSGTVNTTDQSQVKANFGQPVDTAHARFDFNLSGGTVTTTDQAVLKSFVVTPAKTALCP